MVKFWNSCISGWEGRLTLNKGGGSRSFMTMTVTIWWPRSGVRIYHIVTRVTSDVGVPSTRLVAAGPCGASVLWDFSMEFFDCSVIWQILQQQCFWCDCRILERYGNFSTLAHCSGPSRGQVVRHGARTRYWKLTSINHGYFRPFNSELENQTYFWVSWESVQPYYWVLKMVFPFWWQQSLPGCREQL